MQLAQLREHRCPNYLWLVKLCFPSALVDHDAATPTTFLRVPILRVSSSLASAPQAPLQDRSSTTDCAAVNEICVSLCTSLSVRLEVFVQRTHELCGWSCPGSRAAMLLPIREATSYTLAEVCGTLVCVLKVYLWREAQQLDNTVMESWRDTPSCQPQIQVRTCGQKGPTPMLWRTAKVIDLCQGARRAHGPRLGLR